MWLIAVIVGYAMLILPGLILHFICILTAASSRPAVAAPVIANPPAPVRAATVDGPAPPATSGFQRFVLVVGGVLVICTMMTIAILWNDTSTRSRRPVTAVVPSEPSTPPSGNPAHDRLMKLPAPARAKLFTTMFVGDKDDPCDTVTRTFFAGLHAQSKDAFWSVGCNDGHSYQITVKSDATGSTRLLSCEKLRRLARVECFKTLNEQ
jgi:hypothetical protein